jgi:MYXO-CTERM domain-containing protein
MKTLLATNLLALFVAGTATAELLYFQGFEDPSYLGGMYLDTGDSAVDHWLTNNAGEMAVNGEGFSAWYGSTGSTGLTDGDWVGVTDFTGEIGAWHQGLQGYQISDADGVFELHFDGFEGTAEMVSLAIFIATTGYETADSLSIHWGSDPDNGTLYSLDGADGDGNGSVMEDASGSWMFLEFDVSELGAGHLHVRGESNSGSEAYFIDAVSIYGDAVPAPGALALLGLAGIASRRRRK